MIDIIKQEVYQALKTLDGATVTQNNQTVFNETPAITFSLSNIYTDQNLERQIIRAEIEVKVDLWAETTKENSQLLKRVEQLLRQNDWRLTYAQDIPNPDPRLQHTTARFMTVKA